MNDNQAGPPPEPDNLIVHIAHLLREDINIPLHHRVLLRQAPINDDDHDSWAPSDDLENWYYVAYSIIESIDEEKAIKALMELKNKEASNG